MDSKTKRVGRRFLRCDRIQEGTSIPAVKIGEENTEPGFQENDRGLPGSGKHPTMAAPPLMGAQERSPRISRGKNSRDLPGRRKLGIDRLDSYRLEGQYFAGREFYPDFFTGNEIDPLERHIIFRVSKHLHDIHLDRHLEEGIPEEGRNITRRKFHGEVVGKDGTLFAQRFYMPQTAESAG